MKNLNALMKNLLVSASDPAILKLQMPDAVEQFTTAGTGKKIVAGFVTAGNGSRFPEGVNLVLWTFSLVDPRREDFSMARSRDNWSIAQSGVSPPDDKRSDDKRAAGLIPAGRAGTPTHYSPKRNVYPPPLHVHNYIRFPQSVRWPRAGATPIGGGGGGSAIVPAYAPGPHRLSTRRRCKMVRIHRIR